MSKTPGQRILTYLGAILIIVSVCWIINGVFFGGSLSLAPFPGIIFGAILLLIASVKPNNRQE